MTDSMQMPTMNTGTDSAGSHLLDDVREEIRRYCVLPGEHELVAVVLWCALTHLVAEFDYAPRLVIRSAEKRSGKSRLLEIVDGLVYSPLRAVNATVAYVFRSLDKDPPPTLLFDEADTIFGSKRVADKNEDLRGLLNAGFQRGLPFGRVVGSDLTTQEFSTFAMAALAGIGRMPETIEDRAIVVIMKRRRGGEVVHPYRPGRDGPMLHSLRARLAVWADEVRERAQATYPEMPVDDRAADVWEPLIAVADLAGGEWPQLARDAAVALVESASEDDTARSPKLQLLADIRTVFDASFMKSQDLCKKLRALPESPWDQIELSPTALGVRLREYDIKTRHTPDRKERGYRRADFADAFARYLPQEPSEGVQPVPSGSAPGVVEGDEFDCDVAVAAGTGDASAAEKSAGDCAGSQPVPDRVDTFGRGVDADVPRPNPALMPKRLHTGVAIPAGGPKRQRSRTRGRRSSRPAR